MKKKVFTGHNLVAFMLIMLLLAACGDDETPSTMVSPTERLAQSEKDMVETAPESEPTVSAENPTPEPIERPEDLTATAMPEGEAEATPVSEDDDMTSAGIGFSALQGPFGSGWMWASYINEEGTVSDIENPTKYIINFGEDNFLFAVADCNFASGTYALDGNQLDTDIELADLTTCEDGSRSEQFLELMTQGGSLSVEGDSLTIALPEEAGTLVFLPNDPQAAFRVESWDEAAEKFLESCDAPGAVLLVDSPTGRFFSSVWCSRYCNANSDAE